MKTNRAWPLAPIALVFPALAACSGSGDHPPPAADIGPGTIEQQEASVAARTRPSCHPGEERACQVKWTDDDTGQLHCFGSIQTCIAGGFAWTACGESP